MTSVEIDEETFEEIIKVGAAPLLHGGSGLAQGGAAGSGGSNLWTALTLYALRWHLVNLEATLLQDS